MDNKPHSEGLDSKRTNKEVVDLYYDDKPYFRYLYKKTEKIILATYLVTNLFPDNEPLKVELRKLANGLLSKVLLFNSRSLEVGLAHSTIAKFMELGSWLFIANKSLLLSEMNYELIQRELDGLLSLLAELEVKQAPEKNLGLSSHFFKDNPSTVLDGSPFTIESLRQEVSGIPYKGHDYKGQNRMSLMSISRKRSPKVPDVIPKSLPENTDRRSLIVELLQKKPLISVKDVAAVVMGCSEKTLQRELLSMVSDGVLKKEGERRWSRYRMA